MDNKNDRLFYWEVKNFINKKPETFGQKKDSLKESIGKILHENKTYHQNNFEYDTPSPGDVSKYLKNLVSLEEKYTPNHPAYAKNSLVNPFMLSEADVKPQTQARSAQVLQGLPQNPFNPRIPGMPGSNVSGSRILPSGQVVDMQTGAPVIGAPSFAPQQQPPAQASAGAAPQQGPGSNVGAGQPSTPAQQPAPLTRLGMRQAEYQERLRKEKEASDERKARNEEDKAYKLTKELKDLGIEAKGGSVKDIMNQIGPEGREKLNTNRINKENDRMETAQANRIQQLAQKDPKTLTDQEKSYIQIYQMKAKDDPGFAARMKEKNSGAQASQGPMPDGGNRAEGVGANAVDRVLGYSAETTKQSYADENARNIKAIDAEAARKKDLIQGTNMTRAEFKQQTGRDYDAFNKDDSALVSKLAGAGKFGTEEARQGALTSDAMNQRYNTRMDELQRKQGQSDRDLDASRRELNKFRNDPDYRKELRDKSIQDYKNTQDFKDYEKSFNSNQSGAPKPVGQQSGTPASSSGQQTQGQQSLPSGGGKPLYQQAQTPSSSSGAPLYQGAQPPTNTSGAPLFQGANSPTTSFGAPGTPAPTAAKPTPTQVNPQQSPQGQQQTLQQRPNTTGTQSNLTFNPGNPGGQQVLPRSDTGLNIKISDSITKPPQQEYEGIMRMGNVNSQENNSQSLTGSQVNQRVQTGKNKQPQSYTA